MNTQSPNGTSTLLIASLVVNVFLVGGVLGAVLFGGHVGGERRGSLHMGPPIHTFLNPREIIRQLPHEHRQAIITQVHTKYKSGHSKHKDILEKRMKLLELLSADVFNRTEVDAAVESLVSAERSAHLMGSSMAVDILVELDDAERKRVVQLLAARHEQRRNFTSRKVSTDAHPVE